MTATGTPRWWGALGTVVVAGSLVRLLYVLVVADPVAPGLDAIWYSLQGGSIRAGTGFVVPTSLFGPRTVPTAGFPPGYPLYQAAWQAVVGNGPTTVRLAGLLPGAVTIAAVGVLGRRVASARVGLLAAGLVAVWPSLVAVDGSAMSENLTVALVTVIVLVAHIAVTEGATAGRLVLLGVLCGAAALTRQDLLLLVPLLAVPAAVATRRPGRLGRVGAGAVVLAVTVAVVAPWVWRNHREVGSATISTLSPSSALAGSNCDATYGGADLGSWRFPCVEAATPPPEEGADEVAVADAQRSAAVDHARDHISRLALVAVAREARVWGLWDPRDLARRDAEESRRYGWQLVARPLDAALSLAGAAGLVVAVRRRRDALVLVAPLVVVAASALVSYGNPRFGAVARPVLALGVAIVVVHLWTRCRPTTRRPTASAGSAAPATDRARAERGSSGS